MKRTNFSNIQIKKRRHGFLKRMASSHGRKILNRRRFKKRRILSR